MIVMFSWDGNKYFKVNRIYEGLPKLTGYPKISWVNYRTTFKRSIFSKQPAAYVTFTPGECAFQHIINYPYRKWGAPQVSILGTYGYGKSNLLNLIAANWLALGHRILMFDDSAFESRSLAMHGFFPDKGDTFQPFQLRVYVPKGYKFNDKSTNHNPMWLKRKNVTLVEFSNAEEIVDALTAHVLTIIFTEAFTPQAALRLWIDVMMILRERVTINDSYIFMHHELATMFPEGSRKETYALIEKAVAIIKRFRKDRIGILTSFHELSDVTYKLSRKLGFVLYKRPVLKKSMSQVEDAARGFSRSQVNISQAGYWREHNIGLFPEAPDVFRVSPNRTPYDYPTMKPHDEEGEKQDPRFKMKGRQRIWHPWIRKEAIRRLEEGHSYREVSGWLGPSLSTLHDWFSNPEHLRKEKHRVRSELEGSN